MECLICNRQCFMRIQLSLLSLTFMSTASFGRHVWMTFACLLQRFCHMPCQHVEGCRWLIVSMCASHEVACWIPQTFQCQVVWAPAQWVGPPGEIHKLSVALSNRPPTQHASWIVVHVCVNGSGWCSPIYFHFVSRGFTFCATRQNRRMIYL